MLKKNLLVSLLAFAGLLAGVSASAQTSTSQMYVGATVGQAKWNDDCKGTTSCDTTSNAYKLVGGYNVDKNFALEASYFSLGKISATVKSGSVTGYADGKATGFELAGVVKHNFTDEFGGFAKMGLARVSATANANVPGVLSETQDTTSTQPVFGLGLTYNMTKELAVRTEFESRRVKLGSDKDRVNNFSVGMQYSF